MYANMSSEQVFPQEGHFIMPTSQLLAINPNFIWLSSVYNTSLKTGHPVN